MNTALELDPFSPEEHSTESFLFLWTRDYDAAIREARRTLEIDPSFAIGHVALAAALGAKGVFDESFTEWLQYLRLDGNAELAHELESAAKKISDPGDPGPKLAHITLSYYRKKSETEYVAALTIAEAYIDLGDKDKALEWLNKAYEEHSPNLYTIAISPSWDPLRDDPRFQDLLRRIGLAQCP
jgi:FimV-like protein